MYFNEKTTNSQSSWNAQPPCAVLTRYGGAFRAAPQGSFLHVVPSRHCQQASRCKISHHGPWSWSIN